VASVRHLGAAQLRGEFPDALPRRATCALSVIVHALMHTPVALDEVVQRIAPQAEIDATLALRSARRVHEQLIAAAARNG
jgi:hypothetical protein